MFVAAYIKYLKKSQCTEFRMLIFIKFYEHEALKKCKKFIKALTVTSDGVAATSYGTHDNIYLSFGGPLAMSSVLVHGSIVHGYHSFYQRFIGESEGIKHLLPF